MWIQILKGKLHLASVTDACVDYEGSMTISEDLMELAGIVSHEELRVGNIANGKRFETYVIPGERDLGQVFLNGATGHLGKPGDRLTLMTFANVLNEVARQSIPNVVILGKNNEVLDRRGPLTTRTTGT
ncbi:aspartate 1-decarboxylase [Verrucomicrobia bacterium]|jgi:aspartate 1-decarboxylase|nr:aspartate 1-decarboxylase [Verrucomicrobiota bacterium]